LAKLLAGPGVTPKRVGASFLFLKTDESAQRAGGARKFAPSA